MNQDLMLRLREALAASWYSDTAYNGVEQAGNPALGQCYPTARVVLHYFPEAEIIEGKVWTGTREETHFWNGLRVGEEWHHLDLSWQQFPQGSIVRSFVVLEQREIVDSQATQDRCALLLRRVQERIGKGAVTDGGVVPLSSMGRLDPPAHNAGILVRLIKSTDGEKMVDAWSKYTGAKSER
jgi:hypothetical protein